MPVTLPFAHEIPYVIDTAGDKVPALRLGLSHPTQAEDAISITGHLDSGASRTVLQGPLARAIGLEIMDGRLIPLRAAVGASLEGRLHRVRLFHEILGDHEMEVAFATFALARNLLGLDFFNLYKICFHERYQRLLMDREPRSSI